MKKVIFLLASLLFISSVAFAATRTANFVESKSGDPVVGYQSSYLNKGYGSFFDTFRLSAQSNGASSFAFAEVTFHGSPSLTIYNNGTGSASGYLYFYTIVAYGGSGGYACARINW